ncbi:MAG TPA: hypothetical protein VGV09_16475 [Steroidobacteraceae bacterium]|nr:hypothetical protein [Steroidobacteraceae bacterium]
MDHRIRTPFAAGVTVLLAQLAFATASPQATVSFDPTVTASLEKTYGSNEAAVLRSAILSALAKQEQHAALPGDLTLKVTVRQLKPSHPTLKQQLDDPSLSPTRTHYLGGADLVGEVIDSNQHVLANVDYRDFADVLPAGSVSLDPWADARLAIDGFAAKLAATWARLPKN